MVNLFDYFNENVIITTKKDSKYQGTITKITSDKFHLSNLIVLHKDGTYKTVSGNKSLNKRWFNIETVKHVEINTVKFK